MCVEHVEGVMIKMEASGRREIQAIQTAPVGLLASVSGRLPRAERSESDLRASQGGQHADWNPELVLELVYFSHSALACAQRAQLSVPALPAGGGGPGSGPRGSRSSDQ